jgi:hypothetical protein
MGRISPSPVAERFVKLKDMSSTNVRGSPGKLAPTKLPGNCVWQARYTYVYPHASRVNVAPAANSSSIVTR